MACPEETANAYIHTSNSRLFFLHTQRVTPLDLISVATELDNEANQLPASQIEHSTSLKNIAIMLESYQLKVIAKVHHSVVSLHL